MPMIDDVVLQPLLCLAIQKHLFWLPPFLAGSYRKDPCHRTCAVTTQTCGRSPLTITISREAWTSLDAQA
eukprot:scaffold6368_cov18-Tisochrysis_lutea.AAC.1